MSVCAGSWVIVSTNGEKRLFKIDAQTTVFVDNERVPALNLVGIPFGAVLRSSGKGQVCVDEGLAEDINGIAQEWMRAADATEETRTNKALFDDGNAQALTAAQIEKLKSQGLHGVDIVREIAQNSTTFEAKTAFSQHKYLKKKAKKYTPVVQVLRSSPSELCDLYAQTGKLERIHEMRVDSLALLLSRSNARAGSRILVLDTGMGLVLGALAHRLGGHGSLLVAHAKQHVPLDGVHQLNLEDGAWATLAASPLDYVRAALEAEEPGRACAPAALERLDAAVAPLSATPKAASATAPANGADSGYGKSAGRLYRRLTAEETTAWLAQGCDAVVVSMHATEPELLRTLMRALRPSGALVVYNACLNPLSQFAAGCLSGNLEAGGLHSMQLSECWAREYQVLPNRTHPLMTNVQSTGFLLSGFVRQDPMQKRATEPI